MPADYPTEEDLRRIREWSDGDPLGWFAHIKSCWHWPDWGWEEFDGADDFGQAHEGLRIFHLSTGGWSGNEEIIDAMRQHFVLWSLTWQEHRRGGHYRFAMLQKPS